MQAQTEPLQMLPEPHTDFVFTVSGDGGWVVVVVALVVLAATAATAL